MRCISVSVAVLVQLTAEIMLGHTQRLLVPACATDTLAAPGGLWTFTSLCPLVAVGSGLLPAHHECPLKAPARRGVTLRCLGRGRATKQSN